MRSMGYLEDFAGLLEIEDCEDFIRLQDDDLQNSIRRQDQDLNDLYWQQEEDLEAKETGCTHSGQTEIARYYGNF